MTLIKTAELTGVALDWAVAKCDGYVPFSDGISWIIDIAGVYWQLPKYSTDWAHGGPIIERESITVSALYAQKNPPVEEYGRGIWGAFIPCGVNYSASAEGHSPLIAAMRCYVALKLGDVVDVPDVLDPHADKRVPVEGSDIHAIEPVGGVFHVAGFIRSPKQLISIKWEVDNPPGSGSTECEAWRGQYEIDCLTRSGYRVLAIDPHFQPATLTKEI